MRKISEYWNLFFFFFFFFAICCITVKITSCHYVKSVLIQSFWGMYFPSLGLNTKIYRVNCRIQFKCGKIRARKTPNSETFYAVRTNLVTERIYKKVYSGSN